MICYLYIIVILFRSFLKSITVHPGIQSSIKRRLDDESHSLAQFESLQSKNLQWKNKAKRKAPICFVAAPEVCFSTKRRKTK